MSRATVILVLVTLGCGHSSVETKPTPVPKSPGPPAARVEPVVETKFGVTIRDPYRWMEKPENRKELMVWLRAQGAYTRRQLDRIRGLPALREELRRLNMGAATVGRLQRRGARLFYTATEKGESVARLYVRNNDHSAELLFDPSKLGGKAHASIDNYTASPNGKLVAVNVSRGGAEITTIHVFDVATGKRLPDSVSPVWGQFAAAWLPDSSGFLYSHMDVRALKDPKLDKMKNWQVRFHRLGTQTESDPAVLGPKVGSTMPIAPKEFPLVKIPVGSRWAIGLGAGARPSVRLAVVPVADLVKRPVPWRMIAEYSALVRWQGYAVRGDDLFVITTKDAPNGKILRIDLNNPSLARATKFVPESSRVIRGVGASKDALYVTDLVAGTAGLRSVDDAGNMQIHAVPQGTSIRLAAADPTSDEVILGLVGWTRPFGYVATKHASKTLEPIGLSNSSPADFSRTVIERAMVPSSGGVKVPMTMLRNRDATMNGKHPTLLLGYGAYGSTITPFHYPLLQAWLERGGTYAVCHVRGGGAKGRAWQLAGKGEYKHNAVRDFVNCARYLAKGGYTNAGKVAGIGGSMGGILVGRAATEEPKAFGAIRIVAGMLNASRVLKQNNGANQIAELGDPRSEKGFKAVLNMDVYQNVVDGNQYPPMLLSIGLNDQRIAPWMTAKLAARMQASGNRAPTLIRVEADSGHGVGSTRTQETNRTADEWAFILHQFGHPDFGLTNKHGSGK